MQFFSGSSAVDISPSPAAPPGTATGLSGNNANMLYIFNRSGVCLLYREWHRPLRTLDASQDQKLMFGLLFSLRSFTAKMDPTRYVLNFPLFGCMRSIGAVNPSFIWQRRQGKSRCAAVAGARLLLLQFSDQYLQAELHGKPVWDKGQLMEIKSL
ncbi:hypothetical protein GW17_00025758 [Ensete ventricosum]|nr:hypothetical protein GW17_00025758 [Ensete ventricosum]